MAMLTRFQRMDSTSWPGTEAELQGPGWTSGANTHEKHGRPAVAGASGSLRVQQEWGTRYGNVHGKQTGPVGTHLSAPEAAGRHFDDDNLRNPKLRSDKPRGRA